MGKLVLVNFAGALDGTTDKVLRQHQEEQLISARAAGMADAISWDRDRLTDMTFYEKNCQILNLARGGGYWLWKPYVIREALRSVGADDVVVYWDVGRIRPNIFTRPVAPLAQWCLQNDGMLPGVPIGPQRVWTKRDCFHYMDCDGPIYWEARQVQATFSVWSGWRAMEFVSEWLTWCCDRRCLTDDVNKCGLSDLSGFQEHRHDQSVLTNLCVRHGVKALDPLPLPPGAWTKNINIFAEALASPEEDCVPRHPRRQPSAKSEAMARAWTSYGAGESENAKSQCHQVLAASPANPDALHLLGSLYLSDGRMREGIAVLDGASKQPEADVLSIQMAIAEAAMHSGAAAREEVALREALAADRRHAPAWVALSRLLIEQCRQEEALVALRKAMQVRPDDPHIHSEMLRVAQLCPDVADEFIVRERALWSESRAVELLQMRRPHTNVPVAGRKLRIGYVSAHFCRHPMSDVVRSVLARHDRSPTGVEVFLYSSTLSPDELTDDFHRLADHWRDLSAMGDIEAIAALRKDTIDILVDLDGHGGMSRLALFAAETAPVQLSYLGNFDETGLESIRQRITDTWLDPPGQNSPSGKGCMTRLSRISLCYDPPAGSPEVTPPLAERIRSLAFAYFGDPTKVSDEALRAWVCLLRQIPGARLLLRYDTAPPALARVIADEGVEAGRIEKVTRFADGLARLDELARVDVALDSFPISDFEACCDALWMGVPVVSLRGDRAARRIGAALLNSVGLPEMAAESLEEYVELGVALIADRATRTELARTLRQRMRASSLMDSAGLARELETAYRQEWRQWCTTAMQQELPAEAS